MLDQGDEEDTVALDFSPGSDTEAGRDATRRKLLEFARRAEAIAATDDLKLQGAASEIKALIKDGFHPVVFCRFVDTAEYVALYLKNIGYEHVFFWYVTACIFVSLPVYALMRDTRDHSAMHRHV